MLINVRISELLTDNNNSIPSAIIITIVFSLVLYKLLPNNYSLETDFNVELLKDSYVISHTNELGGLDVLNNILFSDNKLLLVTSQTWDGMLAEMSHITTIGSIIYTVYPLWLILTSLILLLAMVGAIVITLK
jgi:NADH-ubiquinone oxidoreductase chain 6